MVHVKGVKSSWFDGLMAFTFLCVFVRCIGSLALGSRCGAGQNVSQIGPCSPFPPGRCCMLSPHGFVSCIGMLSPFRGLYHAALLSLAFRWGLYQGFAFARCGSTPVLSKVKLGRFGGTRFPSGLAI